MAVSSSSRAAMTPRNLAVALLTVLLLPLLCRRESGLRQPRLDGQLAFVHQPLTVSRREQGLRLVAREAAAPAKKKKKARQSPFSNKPGGVKRYQGALNPKLRALLESKEYKSMVKLLRGLQQAGILDQFLANAQKYWEQVSILDLADVEQKAGGNGVIRYVRKDWTKIWPSAVDDSRMEAFETFSGFVSRLGGSSVLDVVMNSVLPGSAKGYNAMMGSEDQKRLMAMEEEERNEEILRRLVDNDIVRQYVALSKTDPDTTALSPQMGPFLAKFVVLLQVKVATQTESLGNLADYGIPAAGLALVVALLLGTGVLKLPGGEAAPAPATEAVSSAPAP